MIINDGDGDDDDGHHRWSDHFKIKLYQSDMLNFKNVT